MVRFHATEVYILERLPFSRGFKRAWRIQVADSSRQLQVLSVSLLVLLLPQWFIHGTLQPLVELFTSIDVYEGGAELLLTVTAVVSMIASLVYLAVLRFCVYLDHRTRTEGWDLELDLRQRAAALAVRIQ